MIESSKADIWIAFFAGNDRFYIRGVDYQPGKPSSDVH